MKRQSGSHQSSPWRQIPVGCTARLFYAPRNLREPRIRSGCSLRGGTLWLSVSGQRVYFLNYKRMWWATSTTSSVLTERSCYSPTLKTHAAAAAAAAGPYTQTHRGFVYQHTEKSILNELEVVHNLQHVCREASGLHTVQYCGSALVFLEM